MNLTKTVVCKIDIFFVSMRVGLFCKNLTIKKALRLAFVQKDCTMFTCKTMIFFSFCPIKIN